MAQIVLVKSLPPATPPTDTVTIFVDTANGRLYVKDWLGNTRQIDIDEADAITFDPSGTGLTSTNVQDAIVELDLASGGLSVENEGVLLGTAGTVEVLNFVGPGVEATRLGNTVTVTVTGSALYDDAVGTKDGVNDTFSMPGAVAYVTGTLTVYLNGVAYQKSSITENGPGYTTFTIVGDHIPQSDDSLAVRFVQG